MSQRTRSGINSVIHPYPQGVSEDIARAMQLYLNRYKIPYIIEISEDTSPIESRQTLIESLATVHDRTAIQDILDRLRTRQMIRAGIV